jgi:Ca2+-binding EF-hand superfamily protein
MQQHFRKTPAATASPGRAIFLALAMAISVGGCWGHRYTAPTAVRLYSPFGEPLSGGPLGRPSCSDALSAWFERVDTKHDGLIDRDAFLADAQRQFAIMDLDKDGTITPAELAQYRAPYQVEPSAAAGDQAAQAGSASGRKHRRGQGGGGSGDFDNDQPDPVMAADVRFRNQVSREDFMAYAARQFTALDVDHHGRLAKADVLSSCGPPNDS